MGDPLISDRTICDWFSYCRKVCMLSMEEKYVNRGKIGGLNHLVQVDECKIGKQKYHRPRGKESTKVRITQNKGKESENSYQELKKSPKDRHM